MKVTGITIQDFHQFKNLDIDLTYPKGHPKAGEPLDKVCIIGQSGTGKTTLLKIIGGYTYNGEEFLKEYKLEELSNVSVSIKAKDIEVELNIFKREDNEETMYGASNYKAKGKEIAFEEFKEKIIKHRDDIKTQFIFFPADLKYDYVESSGSNLLDKRIINFRDENLGDVWNVVLSEIQKFQEEELKLRQAISQVAEKSTTNLEQIQKAVKKLERWKRSANNPIAKVADECLDPLLRQFSLRVKRELDFQKKEDLGFIKIEDINGHEIPHGLLSTGTKQVLLTALPLYLLKPENALILYDEPERSLYPSIQKLIIDFYTGLTKDSQFFFATHSPIIASCFEPWEIVELKFDENGFVRQELYYPEGSERHVDNYNIIPSYLTYDQMLSKVFDLEETHSHERSAKITELLMLRNQLKHLKSKDQMSTPKAKRLYEVYRALADKLFWDFDLSN
jgi:ABC-type lipoprotein export system ATPase subunit